MPQCIVCRREFDSMDECCEHAEKEHSINRVACDECCEEDEDGE